MRFNWLNLLPPTKRAYPDNTGLGPDFPDSAGDRERGKFRPSEFPRLTVVAVANDDGSVVGSVSLAAIEQQALELKAVRLGIELLLAQLGAGNVNLLEMAAVK